MRMPLTVRKSDNLSILFVLPQIYPYVTGGAEIFHYFLMKELKPHASISYIGFDNINDNEIKFLKINKIKPWRFFTPVQIILLLIINRSKFDIVHLNYCQGSWVHWFYYPLLKSMLGIKYGLTIHDPSLDDWKQKKIFKKVFDEAKFVVGVSERLKEGYEQRCNRQIVYLPPLVPFKKYQLNKVDTLKKNGFAGDTNILFFAGSLKSSKRPLLLIEAINFIDREWIIKNKFMLIIAGDGVQKNELKNKIEKYNLNEFIKLLGHIPTSDLNEYYAMASCYVIPSVHEGKSVSLLEAMFNNLPVIASDAPGINDIIKHNYNGLLFKIDDAQELSNTIVKIFSDKEHSQRLAQQAFEDFNNQFSYTNMLDKYLELYR